MYSYLEPPPRNLRCPKQFRQLRKRCLASIKSFQSEGEVVHTPDGNYVFQDNGADILVVAHLDTVQPHFRHFGKTKGQSDIIYNAQLDDRLGVWIALDVLPSLGIKVDVLLTEGEESCRSTAAHFTPGKEYNWIVEFDRGGTNVVMYNYETPELIALLESGGNDIGQGSYSDICELEHLGVSAFNWGIGSYDGHFPSSYFSISECREAIARFVEFHKVNSEVKLPYNPLLKGEWEWSEWEEEDNGYLDEELQQIIQEEYEFQQWECDNWEEIQEESDELLTFL